MTTLGMVGEPATSKEVWFMAVWVAIVLGGVIITVGHEVRDEILRELRKQSEGKGKDGGK